ncbi:MAG: SBBP repeat-containing protein [Candidatus Thorarchaeota archaeon]
MRSRLLCCFLVISVLLITIPFTSDKPLQRIPDTDILLPENLDSANLNGLKTGQFYANHGQINGSNLLYYGYLTNGIIEIKETTISYRSQNQQYVVFEDIRYPRGIQESACTTNFLLGSRGDYKLVKSYGRIILSLSLYNIDISLGIENGFLNVNILEHTSIDPNILQSVLDWIVERIHPMTEGDEIQQVSVPSELESEFSSSSSDALLFSTFLGGPDSDGDGSEEINVVVDEEGNSYVTASTFYPGFPFSYDILDGFSDCFILKFNSSGNLEYVTFIGGSRDDVGMTIDVDESGNLYLVGRTTSTDFPLHNPIFDTMEGSSDMFFLSLDSTGTNLRYSSFFPIGVVNPTLSITLDKDDCMYIAGRQAALSSFPLVNPCDGAYDSTTDSFLTKINYTGTEIVYSTLFGTGSQGIRDVAVDFAGNAYICGYTYSSELPTINAMDSTYCAQTDAFIAKFNSTGNGLEYCTYFGGNGYDSANSLAVDSEGFLSVGGYASANDFEITYSFGSNYFRRVAFILKLNPEGALVFSTQIGGFQNDYINDITINSAGDIYATGVTGSTEFPTVNAFDSGHNGGLEDWDIWDCFVLKLNSTGNGLRYSTYVGGNKTDAGKHISVGPNGTVTVVGTTRSPNFPIVNPIDDIQEEREMFVFKLADVTSDSTSSTPAGHPQITSFGDIELYNEVSYPPLHWLIYDLYPAYYLIYRDLLLIENETWTESSCNVEVDINDLDIGVHYYTIHAFDTDLNSSFSTIIVNVEVLPQLVIEGSDDFIFDGYSPEFSIHWNVTSFESYNYTILLNGTVLEEKSGFTTSSVTMDVSSLPLGTYNYSIMVENSLQYSSDYVLVFVNESSTPTDPTATDTNSSITEYPQLTLISQIITISSIAVILVVTVVIIRGRKSA